MSETVMPCPAATVLLLRDGDGGIEVFMEVRHAAMTFASGALVFPGGRVDPQDYMLAANPTVSPATVGIAPLAGALRVAAIRETYEECGILLARSHGETALLSAARTRAIAARRRRFVDMLAEEGLVLAADRLIHFAHWITPVNRPRRFDTHFFAIAAPEGQHAIHDGSESVASMWITPRDALAGSVTARFKLVFATLMNLRRLDRNRNVAEALDAAMRTPVVAVTPELVARGAGNVRQMRIPAEAGYGGNLFTIDLPPA